MLRLLLVLILGWFPLVGSAVAEQSSLHRAAKVMVHDAVALYSRQGRGALLGQIGNRGNKTFHRQGLFVLVWDRDGTLVGHGLNSTFRGRNMMAVTDAKGEPFIANSIQTAISGGGWVTYDSWEDPVSDATAQWAMYVQPAGNRLVVAVGVRPDP